MSHTLRYKLLTILAVALMALVATRVGAGPESLIRMQPVELLEMVRPGVYTQRTVQIQFATDGRATVCVRGPDMPHDVSRAKCFYKLHKSQEVVVLEQQILGEVAT